MRSIRTAAMPLVLMSMIFLQGCVVAAVPLISAGMMAISGFVTYKTFQTATGGTVQVGFNEETQQVDRQALQSLTSIGVWPAGEGEVFMAEHFEQSGAFSSVITPGQVGQVLREQNASTDLTLLTQSERLALFRSICIETGAEALLASIFTGTETNTNTFSLARGNVTNTADVFVYARDADRIILSTEIELVMGIGSTTPNMTEINRISAEAIVDKVLELRNGMGS